MGGTTTQTAAGQQADPYAQTREALPGFSAAESVFNPNQTQQQLQSSPLISQLKQMQDVARRKAGSAVQQGFQQSGFGRSTFAPQAAAQAGVAAQQPYIQQIAQTGQQQQQQQIQNFMNLLGITQQQGQFGQQFGLDQQRFGLQERTFDEQIRQFEEALRQKRDQANTGFGLGSLLGFGKLFMAPATGGASLAVPG